MGLLVFIVAMACQKKIDSYTAEFQSLRIESEKFRPVYEEAEKRISALPVQDKESSYATPEAADEALALYRDYPPIAPPPEIRMVDLIRRGVPEEADAKEVFMNYYKSFRAKVTPPLRAKYFLANSAERYHWPASKWKALNSTILFRAAENAKSPASSALQVALDTASVLAALEKQKLRGTEDIKSRLKALQTAEKKKNNETFEKSPRRLNALIFSYEKMWPYLPSFVFRQWLKFETEEFREAQQFEDQLKVILLELMEINKVK